MASAPSIRRPAPAARRAARRRPRAAGRAPPACGTASRSTSGAAVNGSRRWRSNVPSTLNAGPGRDHEALARGGRREPRRDGGGQAHPRAQAAVRPADRPRRRVLGERLQQRVAALAQQRDARVDDLRPAGEQLERQQLLEHRAGHVDVGPHGGQLAHQPRVGADPAEPQPAPGRLAHRAERDHAAAGVVAGERASAAAGRRCAARRSSRRRPRARRPARRRRRSRGAARRPSSGPVGLWWSGIVTASRGAAALSVRSHAAGVPAVLPERDRDRRGSGRRAPRPARAGRPARRRARGRPARTAAAARGAARAGRRR